MLAWLTRGSELHGVRDAPGQPAFLAVRLALARYQPDSIPGLELSRVVLADFGQVPPQRTVTVTPDPGPDVFLVDVEGFSAIQSPFIALARVSAHAVARPRDPARRARQGPVPHHRR